MHVKYVFLYSVLQAFPHLKVAYIYVPLCRHWQHELDRLQRGRTPRLWLAVVKLFGVKILAQFMLCACEVCLRGSTLNLPEMLYFGSV